MKITQVISRRILKWTLLLAIVFVGMVDVSVAQGTGAFSRLGFGARGIAMGNALSADVSGNASPYYNPALAPFIDRQNLEATVGLLSFDRSLQFLQLSAPLRRGDREAGLAVGLIHAAVDNIDGRDNSGFHTGKLSIDEFAGFLAFGIRMSERISAGIALQFFRTDLFTGLDPAAAVGIDFGIAVRVTETLQAAIVIDDLLARYSWNTESVNGSGGKKTTDYFPTRIRVGMQATGLIEHLSLAFEYESRIQKSEIATRHVEVFGDEPIERVDRDILSLQENRIRIGAEYEFIQQFAVRAGIEQLGQEVLGGVRPAAGFMIEQEVGTLLARFEYTFSYEAPAAGTMHLLTLRLFL